MIFFKMLHADNTCIQKSQACMAYAQYIFMHSDIDQGMIYVVHVL